MNDTGVDNYITKNGYHFTPDLADYVSEEYLRCNNHLWKSKDLESIKLQSGITEGDVVYYSNKLYKDYFDSIGTPDPSKCMNAALILLTNYPPETSFSDFLNLYNWKKLKIDWEKF